jgi:DNA-nicking Smr family endonuclease
MTNEEIIEIPINGVLDLHTFQPKEVKPLVIDYLEECVKRNIKHVRIIHGKGIGNLRRTVEALLPKLGIVESWAPAGADAGHWGATLVTLKIN